jgi:hypothetical protein
MKPITIIIIIAGSYGIKEGCDAYLRNHRLADAVVAALSGVSVAILAGMAPSPSQNNAISNMRAELLAALQQQAPGTVLAGALGSAQTDQVPTPLSGAPAAQADV